MNQIAAIVAIAFWVSLLSGGALIALSGNRPAQGFLCAILGATLLTAVTDFYVPITPAPYAYLAIDGGLLCLAIYLVLKIDRYWPIWFAGFHSITVGSEISRLVLPSNVPEMYANVAGFWAIPALLAMVAGIILDRRITQCTTIMSR